MSLRSMHSPSSRPALSSRNSNTSKRVCFYKNGDPQFTGQWMVLNNRNFKTFDALLDALSKKVSLPFGVRTITTPKGRHTIWNLGDLQNGGSYVCSDKKKIKPVNLDQTNQRQVPWNATRPTSAGHLGRRGFIRQLVCKTVGRTPKLAQNAMAVWTPKRLVVFKNRNPNTKSIIVLQTRTAPTFQALLDYLSQVMQFQVVKLYTPDGSRVEGLPALILCSGIVVAAGNEPFRSINLKLQASFLTSQLATSESVLQAKKQPQQKVEKRSANSKPRSKHFSISSGRFLVDQVTESLNECFPKHNEHKTESVKSNQPLESDEIESCDSLSVKEQNDFIMPTDDEIEKSFRVNQDGSMTVEMKVHLTVKQEEIIQWTTTISRTCVNSQQMALCSQQVSPVSNISNSNQTAKVKKDNYESKEKSAAINQPIKLTVRGDNHGKCASSEPKPRFRRPTPGPSSIRRKETPAENIKRLTQTEFQESTVGTYSYMECTAEGELMEGYCVVSHSSSSSTTPLPKPKRNSSKTESKHKHGIAEVFQLHRNETGITYTQLASSGAQHDSTNELISLSSSQSSRSQKRHEKSYITDTEIQAGSKSLGDGIKNTELSTSENKIISGKKTGSRQKSKKSQKGAFIEANATDKKQKKCFEDSLKDPQKNNSTDSGSNLESQKKTCCLAKHDQESVKNKKEHLEHKDNSRTIWDLSKSVDFFYIDTLIPHSRKDNYSLPPLHQAPFKTLTKQTFLNNKTKSPNERRELSDNTSLPGIHLNSSDVHQYVKNWLENIQPESVPYMDEMDLHNNDCEPKADTFEKIYKFKNYSMIAKCPSDEMSSKRPVSCPPVMSEKETMATQIIKGLCKSMPFVKIEPATHEPCMRILNSSEELVSKKRDLNGEALENTYATTRSGIKQDLEELCLSIQKIRGASSDSCLTSLENKKRSSLPNFSTQLSSIFSSSSKSIFSLLTVMKLKDESSNIGNIEGSGSYSEAPHLMQSIEKIPSLENKEELKASLSSLHSAPSAHLKSQWKESTDKNNTKEHPPHSPKQSEQGFALEVNSDDDQDKKPNDLKDELDVGKNLHREITFLEGGDLTNLNEAETSIECKNEDIIIKEYLTNIFDKKHRYSEKIENQDSGIPNSDNADLYQLESSVEHRTDITCMLANVQKNQEERNCKETSHPKLYEKKQNLDNIDEHQSPDYSQTDIAANNLEQDHAVCEQSENEPFINTSTSFTFNSDLNDDQSTQQEQSTDSSEKCDSNTGEEDIRHFSASKVKNDIFYNNEDYKVEQLNNFIFKKEENRHDTARSDASNCSIDNGLKDDKTTAYIQDVDELSKMYNFNKDFKTQVEKVFKRHNSSKSSSFSSKCVNIETLKAQSWDIMGMEEPATYFISQCQYLMEIPQQLLDFVNLALKTSALTVECDSNGQPRIHPDKCKISEMSFSQHSEVYQCAQKCLPSPNTSDLSDYRPDTTNNSENLSQVSTDLLTESGNDETDKQDNINETTMSINRALNNGSMKSYLLANSNQIASPSLKSIKSLAFSHNNSKQQLMHCNTSDLINRNPKTIQCLPNNAELDSIQEGILIDKGRWLLKENHLIRKSPPLPSEMYKDADSTSADTGQENADDDYKFESRTIQQPTLDAMSSSEIEDMTKPITPTCTYFNMIQSSDSDPFLDNKSIESKKRRCVIRKTKELKVSPMAETSKMCAKQTGSLPSFASAKFKLAARKVHPEEDPSSSTAKSVSHHSENDPADDLNLTCGQHCPIL